MRVFLLVVLWLAALADTAAGQRMFDEWPVRTHAGPDALSRGAEAVFWNPAAIPVRAHRGEVMVADQRTPDAVGVGGFAAAAAWRLDAATTVAAGYQHMGIDDIGETSESPLPDPGIPATFSIGEDQIYLSAAYVLGSALTAGAGVRYDRSNESGIYESTTSFNGGLLYTANLASLGAFAPAAGATITVRGGGVRWSGGVDFAIPSFSSISTRIGYGVRGGAGIPAPEHRLGATALWRQMLTVTLGAMSGSGGGARAWEPTLGASLRVRRYELGVLREALANEFGAAYSFRLRVGID